MEKVKCLKCEKKDKKIKELNKGLNDIYKKIKQDEKSLKFLIADVLRVLNGKNLDVQTITRELKEFGGVQQYHNYPKDKKPEMSAPVWVDGKTF